MADEQTRLAVMVITKMAERIEPRFSNAIGIDSSGAQTPDARLSVTFRMAPKLAGMTATFRPATIIPS